MRLVLIRHGKSDWKSGTDDFFRPLNKRGLRDAPSMARRLKSMGIIPDRIITSSAVRALTTARLMADVFGLEELEERQDLYLAEEKTIIYYAFRALRDADCLFMVGHNPGMSWAATSLRRLDTPLPTCGVVILDVEQTEEEWQVTGSRVLRPGDLKSAEEG